MIDVHVIGAGPAGLYAAIQGAKNSLNVLVSEEHKKIGLPVHCSGLISASGLEQLNKIVKYRNIIKNEIKCAKIYSRNNSMELCYNYPKAYVVDRKEIDYQAYEFAIEQGVKIENKKISQIQDLKSCNIVGADGPISTIAKLFNFPSIKKFAICYQADYKIKNIEKHTVEIYLDKELFGGFFGWKIPIDEESAKIGFGITQNLDFFKTKKIFLARFPTLGQISKSFTALIPLELRAKTAMKNAKYNINLAGDSAGQTKASSGGGIFFSAMCGTLAGKYYNSANKYEEEWKKKYYVDLLLHQLIHKNIEKSTNKDLDRTIDLIKKLKIDKYLKKYGEMDQLTKMFEIRKVMDYFSLALG
ncbi:MAG: NAD(P)/FAD-dependent oxidoreductase [Candidatus Micrarchaeota archaeon]|nr:NAD(P)/FAD-dependent oxidoreductase [Candidatus Micrarchaeota archaeon]